MRYLIILCLFLTSCLTVRQIERNKETICDICDVKDSIVYRTNVVFRDSLITITLPGTKDTVYLEKWLKPKDNVLNLDTVWNGNEAIEIWATVIQNKLSVGGVLLLDTIRMKIQVKDRITERYEKTTKEPIVIYKDKPIKTFLYWWFGITLFFLIILAVIIWVKIRYSGFSKLSGLK